MPGIKTKTCKGRGYNELLFDDTLQEERTKPSSAGNTIHGKQLNIFMQQFYEKQFAA